MHPRGCEAAHVWCCDDTNHYSVSAQVAGSPCCMPSCLVLTQDRHSVAQRETASSLGTAVMVEQGGSGPCLQLEGLSCPSHRHQLARMHTRQQADTRTP
jgi:hypothetical protein